MTVKISNPSRHGLPVTFGNPLATVPQSSPQIFGFPQGASNCHAQLLPKEKCKLTVLFAPQYRGKTYSVVTIFDNAGNANQEIELVGSGK